MAVVNDTVPPILTPIFNPKLLDNSAAGDINASKPEKSLIDVAASIPLHFYDWWASAGNCPPPMASETVIPLELEHTAIEPFGTPLPWRNWDLAAPVSDYFIHFSGQEIQSMWEEGSAQISPNKISHLDALLSHVWL
jgi:hypothetical protein